MIDTELTNADERLVATPAGADGAEVVVRPARPDEADDLFGLIDGNLETGHLLPRPRGEVALHVPRFFVAVSPAGVAGCAELSPLGPTVAEVRSLVVADGFRGRGIGTRLLRELLRAARQQGFPVLCAYVHEPRPFVRLGFAIVPHPWIPEKISINCHACTWFRRCEQYAVVLDLTRERRTP
jgi:amino-acid N-acetyltransferase